MKRRKQKNELTRAMAMYWRWLRRLAGNHNSKLRAEANRTMELTGDWYRRTYID